ncbi:hypothetical protein CDN99_03155 [Roseateles aquatilis]|uniref:Uncharacterized protein n=1 Tax=Roseateles aquatilis TaxID=431061 RepID=A0A246JLU7_9BURK|nr:hypothetical protein [Roseateles aquatilis]OWQ93483.1 hypothetical protein CDN99_03155 [Roseateles aquatilis]
MDTQRRGVVMGGVVLVHLAVIQLWIVSLAREKSGEPLALPIRVVLRPLEADRAAAAERRYEEPARYLPAKVIIAAPEVTVEGGATGSTGTPDAGAQGSAPGSGLADGDPLSTGPLRLRPSREAIRGAFANPAVVDPRANSPRPTAEEKMAMAIDPELCLLVDRNADGTDRRRWGKYTMVAPAIQEQTGWKGKPVRVCAG